IEGDVLDIGKPNAGFTHAVGDRLRGEAGPMLHPAESLLFCRRNEYTLADQRGRGIAVEGIDAENDHGKIKKISRYCAPRITKRGGDGDRSVPARSCIPPAPAAGYRTSPASRRTGIP